MAGRRLCPLKVSKSNGPSQHQEPSPTVAGFAAAAGIAATAGIATTAGIRAAAVDTQHKEPGPTAAPGMVARVG